MIVTRYYIRENLADSFIKSAVANWPLCIPDKLKQLEWGLRNFYGLFKSTIWSYLVKVVINICFALLENPKIYYKSRAPTLSFKPLT